MAGRTDLYIGTIRGLLICRRGEGGDAWHPIRRTLEARPVAQIVPGLTGPRHLLALVRGEGVFHSTDGGQEWRLRLPAVVACLLEVPQAPGRVYAGLAARTAQAGTAQLGEVMVSHDGGTIWSAVGALPGTPADISVLTLAVTTLPPDLPVLWAGLSGGGVVASYDGGASWQWRRSGLALRAPITRLAPLRARRPGLYAAGGAGIAYLGFTPGQRRSRRGHRRLAALLSPAPRRQRIARPRHRRPPARAGPRRHQCPHPRLRCARAAVEQR